MSLIEARLGLRRNLGNWGSKGKIKNSIALDKANLQEILGLREKSETIQKKPCSDDDVNHFESVTPCCSHSLTASNTEDSNGEGAAGVVQPPEVATRAPFRSLNRSSSSSFLSPSSDCFNPGTLSAAKSLYITISMTSVSEEKGHPIKKPTCHDH